MPNITLAPHSPEAIIYIGRVPVFTHSSGGSKNCADQCANYNASQFNLTNLSNYSFRNSTNGTLICSNTCSDISLWAWLGPIVGVFGFLGLSMLVCCIYDVYKERHPSTRYLSFRDNVRNSTRNMFAGRDRTTRNSENPAQTRQGQDPEHQLTMG